MIAEKHVANPHTNRVLSPSPNPAAPLHALHLRNQNVAGVLGVWQGKGPNP